jgi:protein-tyrosine sulfotransferase
MAFDSPIFILSCERSGSTLLRYILDTHPDISCPGELFLGRLIKDLNVTVSRTIGLAPGEKPREQGPATQREVHRILHEMLTSFAHSRGKKIWCDKTPANLKNLPEIESTFPEARFICLYRNSLDVVQSCMDLREKGMSYEWTVPYMAKHLQNYLAGYGMGQNPAGKPQLINPLQNYLDAMLENWLDKTENLLRFEKNHPKTCRLRYEDLIANPAQALDRVFKFLELEWNPSLLDQVFAAQHDQGGGDYKIDSTRQIEKEHVGRGAAIDSALLANIPLSLKERQTALNLELGYTG